MSSFIDKVKNKVEATLDKNNSKGDDSRSDNYGPHSSNISNKADPRIHSDRDGRNDHTSRTGGYGTTQARDEYGDTRGVGGVTSSDTYGSSTNDPGYDDPRSGNTGPHSIANKLDPRADPDRDGRNDPDSRVGGYGSTQQYGDSYGQSEGVGGLGSSRTAHSQTTTDDTSYGQSDTYGTGSSGTGLGSSETGYGSASGVGTGTTGYGSSTSGYDNPASSNDGPHRSNIANKVDPRFDSDRDGRNNPTSRTGGYGNTQTTTGGYGNETGGYGGESGGYGQEGTTGTGGTYGSSYGAGGAGGYGSEQTTTSGRTDDYGASSYTPGSGKASDTAGPHNSNILNKLDPRVDSDLDGSKTYGGDQTRR